MEITPEVVKGLPFRPFRKTSALRARPLTYMDYIQRQGIIHSLEASASFHPGDYLACGIFDEEWLISARLLHAGYEPASFPDQMGFVTYYPKSSIRQACQISEPFVLHWNGVVYLGKAGDYLVRAEDDIWIVDRVIFEHTYQPTSSVT
ncbi:hypothetical protein [Dictyobacter aurantiacus]|uniref:Uncharacterized protein n=1 Tax=Dictyobacter aurantiacus TaxID=1936993 RepID=A0A401ZIZ9_9CHLR|nr:hypothetical protein [Dictyobacter aurantiacus]GCE06804.1 hypothetical protein KDAU_41330 [Dictyobacter aurantiacus]